MAKNGKGGGGTIVSGVQWSGARFFQVPKGGTEKFDDNRLSQIESPPPCNK